MQRSMGSNSKAGFSAENAEGVGVWFHTLRVLCVFFLDAFAQKVSKLKKIFKISKSRRLFRIFSG